jgi:hypothetical protein
MADMTPAFANRMEPPPAGVLSRPVWLSSNLGQFAFAEPRYDDRTHRIRVQTLTRDLGLQTAGGNPGDNVVSAELDGSGAIVPLGPGNHDISGNPAYDHSLLSPGAPAADWRSASGPLPNGFAVGGNPPVQVTERVAALQLNTSDSATVKVSGALHTSVRKGPTAFSTPV